MLQLRAILADVCVTDLSPDNAYSARCPLPPPNSFAPGATTPLTIPGSGAQARHDDVLSTHPVCLVRDSAPTTSLPPRWPHANFARFVRTPRRRAAAVCRK
jgi:hypothetical protein